MSVLPVLVHIPHVPCLVPTGFCVSIQRSWSRYYHTDEPRGLLDSCGARPHPGTGRIHSRAARFHEPRFQRLRHRRFAPPTRPGCPACHLSLQLLTLGCGAGNARAASAAQVLAIPPPTPTQAYRTHCPPMAAIRPAPSESALAAPPHQCPARFWVLCLVCISLSVPPILLPAKSTSLGPFVLTPAGPSSLPNRPDSPGRRFVSSLYPHRACQTD